MPLRNDQPDNRNHSNMKRRRQSREPAEQPSKDIYRFFPRPSDQGSIDLPKNDLPYSLIQSLPDIVNSSQTRIT
jgi:hypothetical protein